MSSHRLLADLVLVVHFGVVVFVVGGLLVVLIGNARGWVWVNGRWFRLAHLAAIGVVAAQAWLGQRCPLTSLESWLRVQAGGTAGVVYRQGFIEHWLQRLIYFDAPPWVFTLAYSGFALLVVLAWWRFPPHWRP